MEVEAAVRSLRAVRSFSPAPLADEDLSAILHAGRRAGSSKNLQRWAFIVIRDRDRLGRLAEVGAYADHLAGAAVAIALVTPDPAATDSPLSVTWDLGRAAQNMLLVAWARGIGAVPATVYEHDRCRAILGYPADRHCEYILSLGRPADPAELTRPPRAGRRRSIDEIVHFERWGDKNRRRHASEELP
ncbi:MAG TPA: nitroreductase family protein [Candidatus Limnocylindria bacterium]|jgi:nitroreductase|nr:nitroreductase family protein [Candidatus Limnocylindria bacterium]